MRVTWAFPVDGVEHSFDGAVLAPASGVRVRSGPRRRRVTRWWRVVLVVGPFLAWLGWSTFPSIDVAVTAPVPNGGVISGCTGDERCSVIYRYGDRRYAFPVGDGYGHVINGEKVPVFVAPEDPGRFRLFSSGPVRRQGSVLLIRLGFALVAAYALRVLLRPLVKDETEPAGPPWPGAIRVGLPRRIARTIWVGVGILWVFASVAGGNPPAALVSVVLFGAPFVTALQFELRTTPDALVERTFRTKRIPWCEIAGFGVFVKDDQGLHEPQKGGPRGHLRAFRWTDSPESARRIAYPVLLFRPRYAYVSLLTRLRDQLEMIRLARCSEPRPVPPELAPYLRHQAHLLER